MAARRRTVPPPTIGRCSATPPARAPRGDGAQLVVRGSRAPRRRGPPEQARARVPLAPARAGRPRRTRALASVLADHQTPVHAEVGAGCVRARRQAGHCLADLARVRGAVAEGNRAPYRGPFLLRLEIWRRIVDVRVD